MRSINDDNPHIIMEEDIKSVGRDGENKSGSNINGNTSSDADASLNYDIYNSGGVKKNRLSSGDFLKFFSLPLIIIAFLIAAILILKFMFFPAAHKKIKSNKTGQVKPLNNVTVKNNKRFSPSVFSYIEQKKNGGSHHGAKESNKFKIKFNKEMRGLKKTRLNKNLNGDYRNTPDTSGQIPSKMVVFLKASYGKAILNKEMDIKTGAKSIGKTAYKPPVTASKLISSEVAIPEGTVINAYIKYKIFSYNTEVPIIAILSNSYLYHGKIILKKGDKIFGIVGVKHSLNRLNMSFDKIIKINGHSINIDAIAMMPDGSGGIKGNVHYHYAGNIVTSLAQGIIGAASIFVGGGSGINSSNPYTFQNQIRENVAQNELNQAQNGVKSYANSNQNISITLPKDTPIKIIFLKPVYIN